MRFSNALHGVPERIKKEQIQDKENYAAFEIDLKNDDQSQIDQELDKQEQKKLNKNVAMKDDDLTEKMTFF